MPVRPLHAREHVGAGSAGKGDLGAVLEELGSADSIRGLVTAMVSAGLGTHLMAQADVLGDLPVEAAIGDRLTRELQQNLIQASVDTALDVAILGEELDDALVSNLRGVASATIGTVAAQQIGQAAASGDIDRTTQLIAHAALGCATGAVGTDDCSSGAIGAFAGELSALIYTDAALNNPELIGENVDRWQERGIAIAEIVGGLAAAAAGGSANVGAEAGANAAEENAFWIPVLLVAAYLTYEGEGNPIEGLITVGRGEDIASQLLAAGAEDAIAFSSAHFPDQTAAVLNAAAEAGELAGIVVTYIDDTTGNRVSGTWNSFPADVQDAILGGAAVASFIIPAGAAGRIGRAVPDAPNKLPVPDDLPTNIHMGQQGKHIRGHNNFQEGRSYFNDGVDPTELLAGVHSGQYAVVGTGARGNPIVEFGRPIGVDGRTGQVVTRGQIHYGNNGAHIVPDARN